MKGWCGWYGWYESIGIGIGIGICIGGMKVLRKWYVSIKGWYGWYWY